MHLKEGTEDELLVVGVFFDVREYGSNVEVRALDEVGCDPLTKSYSRLCVISISICLSTIVNDDCVLLCTPDTAAPGILGLSAHW